MSTIQIDLSDPALVTSIRANLCEFFRHLHEATGLGILKMNTLFAGILPSLTRGSMVFWRSILQAATESRLSKKPFSILMESKQRFSLGGWIRLKHRPIGMAH